MYIWFFLNWDIWFYFDDILYFYEDFFLMEFWISCSSKNHSIKTFKVTIFPESMDEN